MVRTTQQPILLSAGEKRSVRTQFAALCYRLRKGKTQVLLISSRNGGRWIIPKGWPMHEMTPAQASKVEAFEEAGVEGKVLETCLGIYSTVRQSPDDEELPCIVAVFPLRVKRLLKKYPESTQRTRKWCSPKKAAKLIDDPELAQIVAAFDPARLPS